MLPTSAEVEPATFWSPVGRRIQLSHRGLSRLVHSFNRLVYSFTRLVGSLTKLAHSFTRLAHSLIRLVQSFARLVHSLTRPAHSLTTGSFLDQFIFPWPYLLIPWPDEPHPFTRLAHSLTRLGIIIRRENFMFSWVQHDKSFITSGLDYLQLKWGYIINPKYSYRQASASSMDPDQMPKSTASDLGLHSLPLFSFLEF